MLKAHDRYLIYRLLGRSVEIRLPVRQGGQRLKGVVEKVCRDIFENEVQVTIGGLTHAFREPSAIIPDGINIHFLYGDVEEDEEDDFTVPTFNAYDENINEHLKQTARNPVSKMVFLVGEVEKTPRNRWRSRVAV